MKVELLTRELALEVGKAMLKCRLEREESMREVEAAEEQAGLERKASVELNEELATSFEAAVLCLTGTALYANLSGTLRGLVCRVVLVIRPRHGTLRRAMRWSPVFTRS